AAAARERLEDRLTERLDQRRRADDVCRGEPPRDLVVRDATYDADAAAALEIGAKRTVADEREAAAADACERIREAHDVLPRRQRADAEKRRPLEGGGGLRVREASQVDAGVDDVRLA